MSTAGENPSEPSDNLPCEAAEARLVGGARPGDDPALAAHLGSCLRCFRTATELRDVPRLEALLRAGRPEVDPGERFWESFPARVTGAWQSSHAPKPSFAQRLAGWMRLPGPAAFAGAACAAGVVYLLVRGPVEAPVSPAPPVAAVSAAEPAAEAEDDAPAAVEPDEELGEDFLHSLDATGLELLLDPGRAEVTAEAVETDADGASVAEEIDLLDDAELLALSEKLGRRI
jgi:hypothetical protein